MDNEIKFYQFVKVLDKISSSCDIDEDLIQLFNMYISSNKNFKYNGTYLNDSIDGFKSMIEIYNIKKNIACGIMKQFENEKVLSEYTFIIVDHLFVIKNTIAPMSIVDVVEKYITKDKEQIHDVMRENVKRNLMSETKEINLYNMRKDSVIVKYYDMNIDLKNPIYISRVNNALELNWCNRIAKEEENAREVRCF